MNTWVPDAGDGATPADGLRNGGPVEFEGFEQTIDELGGVPITVSQPYSNREYAFPVSRSTWTAPALAYIRDLGPAARSATAPRKQAIITAVFARATSQIAQRSWDSDRLYSSVTNALREGTQTITGTDLVNRAWGTRAVVVVLAGVLLIVDGHRRWAMAEIHGRQRVVSNSLANARSRDDAKQRATAQAWRRVYC